jgi:hypothetical protein
MEDRREQMRALLGPKETANALAKPEKKGIDVSTFHLEDRVRLLWDAPCAHEAFEGYPTVGTPVEESQNHHVRSLVHCGEAPRETSITEGPFTLILPDGEEQVIEPMRPVMRRINDAQRSRRERKRSPPLIEKLRIHTLDRLPPSFAPRDG